MYKFFSVAFNPIDTNDILDIHKYFMKRTWYIFLMKKKQTCKAQNHYILLVFLLITIALLIAISTYNYLIKYQAKQKHVFTISQDKIKNKSILITIIENDQ